MGLAVIVPRLARQICDFFPHQNEIQEDSTYLKAITCLPFIGAATYLLANTSLHMQIQNNRNLNRVVELIRVKNEYMIASVVRSMLLIAILVVTIASTNLGTPLTIVFGGLAFLNGLGVIDTTRSVLHNRMIIRELRQELLRELPPDQAQVLPDMRLRIEMFVK